MVKVSVVIAAYRAGATLPRAVECCLAQEGVTVEVLIVDDASPDDTFEVAEGLAAADARVRVIRLAENGGPGVARNAGFAAATGDWVAVLDADDTMTPDRLRVMTDFGAEKGADAVYDNLAMVRVDQPSSEPGVYLDPATFGQAAAWDLPFFVSHNQARPGQPSLGYLKPVFRRETLTRYNLRYAPQLRNGEDFHLMLEALMHGADLWYLPRPMYRYTTGAASISSTLNLDHAAHLIAASTDFIGENRDNLPRNVIDLMKVRRRRLADFASAEKFLRAVKARRFAVAASALATRPRALFRIGQQLTQALAKRL